VEQIEIKVLRHQTTAGLEAAEVEQKRLRQSDSYRIKLTGLF